ncbi:MAG: hypothetical protein LBH76_02215, partial [Propionibacteriaceae bacterium]|nr:hypothetical protein [Propionibacteriaceae bacterium]
RRVAETGPAGRRSFDWDERGCLVGITATTRDGAAVCRRLAVDPDGELAAVDGQAVWWDSASPLPQILQIGPTTVVPAGLVDAVTGSPAGPAAWSDPALPAADPWAPPADPAGLAGVGLAGGSLTIDGLTWLGARVLDPISRAFLSTDPLAAPPGAPWAGDPYGYAGGDPVNRVDPWGLSPVSAADFGHYRDQYSSGLAGMLGQAALAAGAWLHDNWEYVAAGAMAVAGGVLMATGVGGPVGMTLIGAGADAIIQKATTGAVNWTEVAISATVGLISGGVGGAIVRTAGAGLKTAVLAGAASGAVEGTLNGTINYALSPGPHTLQGYLGAAGGGLVNGALSGAGGAIAGHTLESAGHGLAGLINRHRGFDPQQTALNTAQQEAARVVDQAANPADIPRVTAASVDPTMPLKPGNNYNIQTGFNRDVPSGEVHMPEAVQTRLPQTSARGWTVDNCAEVSSVSQIVNAGSDIDNVVTQAVTTQTGLPKLPCPNCASWLPGL